MGGVYEDYRIQYCAEKTKEEKNINRYEKSNYKKNPTIKQ